MKDVPHETEQHCFTWNINFKNYNLGCFTWIIQFAYLNVSRETKSLIIFYRTLKKCVFHVKHDEIFEKHIKNT